MAAGPGAAVGDDPGMDRRRWAVVWCAMWLTPEGPLGGELFAHAYLVAFTFYLSIALGALFFVMLHHLSRAGWSVTLRRLAEALSANLFLLAPLALLLVPAMPGLYEWAACWAAEIAGCSGGCQPRLLSATRPATSCPPGSCSAWPSISPSGFSWRGTSAAGRSARTPTATCDWSRRMERMSVPGMIALGLTITLAAVDLLMSLNPHWSSTIFGVYFFGGSVLSGLVVLTLLGALAPGRRTARRGHHRRTLPRPGQAHVRLRHLLGLHRLQPVHADLVRQHAGGDAVLHAPADRPLGGHLAGACSAANC